MSSSVYPTDPYYASTDVWERFVSIVKRFNYFNYSHQQFIEACIGKQIEEIHVDFTKFMDDQDIQKGLPLDKTFVVNSTSSKIRSKIDAHRGINITKPLNLPLHPGAQFENLSSFNIAVYRWSRHPLDFQINDTYSNFLWQTIQQNLQGGVMTIREFFDCCYDYARRRHQPDGSIPTLRPIQEIHKYVIGYIADGSFHRINSPHHKFHGLQIRKQIEQFCEEMRNNPNVLAAVGDMLIVKRRLTVATYRSNTKCNFLLNMYTDRLWYGYVEDVTEGCVLNSYDTHLSITATTGCSYDYNYETVPYLVDSILLPKE